MMSKEHPKKNENGAALSDVVLFSEDSQSTCSTQAVDTSGSERSILDHERLGSADPSKSMPFTDDELRKVSFTSLEVISFPIELGDNPACSDGLPIQLGSKPIRSKVFDVEEFEKTKGGRSEKDLKIQFMRKRRMLQPQYSNEELAKRMDEVEQERRIRKRSTQRFLFR